MDSLVNYASDGENSNNSVDIKMFPGESGSLTNRRASDANYDPVQMDMSEESNNNNSSDESSSDHGNNSPPIRRDLNVPKRDSPTRFSPPLRQPEHEKHSVNRQEESKRSERSEKGKHSYEKSRRSSYDERKRRSDSKDSKDHKRSRDDDRRSRDDERKRERDRVSSSRDERDKSHRDDRRDRDRDRDRERDRDRGREKRRDRDRDRGRRRSRDGRSRDGRSKDQYRDERSSYHKDKDRTVSRSRSRDGNQSGYRSLSYREEKNRNKLAQLEKLGIELKTPEDESGANNSQEQNFYNPLTTATQGKYAEQIQKRKLLWANKKSEEGKKPTPTTTTTSNTWVGTTFTHDQDGKVTAKFKRLMGIKEDLPAPKTEGSTPEILKKQEEMFTNMEQQYEVARATTHTQRGVGLGYATGGYQFPR